MSTEESASAKTKSIPRVSDKRAKFVDLAQKRTINAIKAIRVIGKLGNKSHYDYAEADVSKITRALQKEIDSLKVRMTSKGTRESVEFEL